MEIERRKNQKEDKKDRVQFEKTQKMMESVLYPFKNRFSQKVGWMTFGNFGMKIDNIFSVEMNSANYGKR